MTGEREIGENTNVDERMSSCLAVIDEEDKRDNAQYKRADFYDGIFLERRDVGKAVHQSEKGQHDGDDTGEIDRNMLRLLGLSNGADTEDKRNQQDRNQQEKNVPPAHGLVDNAAVCRAESRSGGRYQRTIAHVGADLLEWNLLQNDAEGNRNADAGADALNQAGGKKDSKVRRYQSDSCAEQEAQRAEDKQMLETKSLL